MPSQTEEDPEYPAKVAAYLKEHKLKELPWGFILARGSLTAVSTYRERKEHSAKLLLDVLIVKKAVNLANVLDAPAVVEPVTGEDAGHGAAAAGVKPADTG